MADGEAAPPRPNPSRPRSRSRNTARRRRSIRKQKTTGSLSRRMIFIAAGWIMLLLTGGGFALDRVLAAAVTRNFDDQLEYVLTALIVSSEIGPEGEVVFNREPADQRFLEPYSGALLAGQRQGPRSPSVAIAVGPAHGVRHATIATWLSTPMTARQFGDEKLRILERDVRLPGIADPLAFPGGAEPRRARRADQRAAQDADPQLPAARARADRDGRAPDLLRPAGRSAACARRSRGCAPASRARSNARMPNEVAPLVEELNALIEHNEKQAEEARRHAGNLAHALKTPLDRHHECRHRPGRRSRPRRWCARRGRCAARSTTTSPAPAPSAGAARRTAALTCGPASKRSSARWRGSTAMSGST